MFGTCNPRGNNRFDPRRSLAEQLQISGPLLSRFDLVLLLLDDLDPGFDEALADHLLEQHSAGGGGASAGAQASARLGAAAGRWECFCMAGSGGRAGRQAMCATGACWVWTCLAKSAT